jgi:ferredoxin
LFGSIPAGRGAGCALFGEAGLQAGVNSGSVPPASKPQVDSHMSHVVTSKCAGCKFTDCVEVCPVACFYELDNQVVIHPEDCIDCTACVDVCPVQAIYLETNVPDEFRDGIEFNAAQARQLKDSGHEAIIKQKEPLPTAEQRKKDLGY